MNKPLLLAILDGWGINESTLGNAVSQANTPHLDKLLASYPHTELSASGFEVGLPEGQMGNSEVGHQNIGAGRIVFQNLPRITKAIKDGSFFENKELLQAIDNCKENNSSLHLLGLVSDGGVHSHNTHLYALLQLAKNNNLQKVFVHCFLDGRDTAPDSALGFVKNLEAKIKEIGCGQIASISGRYYSMDRDTNWDKTKISYDMLTLGKGDFADNAVLAIENSYKANKQDEFVMPTLIVNEGKPIATIKDNDSIIFFNFRPDRAKQLSYAFTKADFAKFERAVHPSVMYVTFTQYASDLNGHVAYPPIPMTNTLGEVLANKGLKQLRIAETEKFAHVTRFFNGDSDVIFAGEERELIPSPKIATYDLQPEMSIYKVTEELLTAIDKKIFDVIILNFANCDMVGHTGIMSATIKAVEAVDTCMDRVTAKILENEGIMLVTADHGNAESMLDNGKPMTAHTTTPVPLILVGNKVSQYTLHKGTLADIAPTILELLNIEQPEEMTGKSLLHS